MIRLQGLTKDFGNGKGLFDVTFEVGRGEVFGYLGPNGAGKSTTIRHLMGFMKPSRGTAEIKGLDCWSQAATIQEGVGYLPGEITFLQKMNGMELLALLGGMRNMKSTARRDELIERLQFDAKMPIRKMSKGMKQKVGLVAAFMHEPEVLILDEPTSGLDPLMQQVFLELVLEEKTKGTTILMSSHLFQEVERVCDRVAIIKDGRLLAIEDMQELKSKQRRTFAVTLRAQEDVQRLLSAGLHVVQQQGLRVEVSVQGDPNALLRTLALCDVRGLDVHVASLEDLFMHYYDRKEGIPS